MRDDARRVANFYSTLLFAKGKRNDRVAAEKTVHRRAPVSREYLLGQKVRSPSGSLVRPNSLPRYLRPALRALPRALFPLSTPSRLFPEEDATRFSSFLLFALPRVHRVRAPIDLAAPSLDSRRVLS